MHSILRPVFFAVTFAVTLPFVFWSHPAAAAEHEMECRVLLSRAKKAIEIPKVFHAKAWGIIHIQTSQGKCVEPIEVWRTRNLPWKVIELAEGAEPPEFKRPPKPKPKPKSDPRIPLPKADEIFMPPEIPGGPSSSADCNRKLDEFWVQDWHNIKGREYWTSDVYTIDHNGDGVTDNIGFRLKRKGKPDLDIRYFAPMGQIPGIALSGLKLTDERVIPWICFGRITLTEPPVIELPKELSIRPDLAREMMLKKDPSLKTEEEKEKEGEKKKPEEPKGVMFWVLLGTGIVIVLGGGGFGAFWFVKRRRGSRGDDEEDEEDDEDEDY
ncbi:MAG: hypothetical protein V3R66_08445 [Rhodospirillales bacterium]